jgi:hypothetical protein
MNTKSLTAKMLSRFKESLHSWISLWRFLANLHDLNFYQGLEDPQREIWVLGRQNDHPLCSAPVRTIPRRTAVLAVRVVDHRNGIYAAAAGLRR